MENILDNDKTLAYYIFKCLNAMIYSSSKEEYDKYYSELAKNFLFDDYILETIENLAWTYAQSMSETMRENFYKVTSYFRFNYEFKSNEERKKIFEICNRILTICNRNDDSKRMELIISNFLSRGFTGFEIIKVLLSIESYAVYAFESNMVKLDFEILSNFSNLTKEEKFNIYAESLLMNDKTLNSISLLLEECPELLLENTFSNRIKNFMEEYKNYKIETKNKKILKKYKKQEKIIKKKIKGFIK